MAISPEKLRFLDMQRTAIADVVGEDAADEFLQAVDMDAYLPFRDFPLPEYQQWCIRMKQHGGLGQDAPEEGELPDAFGP